MNQDPQPISPAALPTLYVSHGAPLFALAPGNTGPALTQWGAQLRAQRDTLEAEIAQLRGERNQLKGALQGVLGMSEDAAPAAPTQRKPAGP